MTRLTRTWPGVWVIIGDSPLTFTRLEPAPFLSQEVVMTAITRSSLHIFSKV